MVQFVFAFENASVAAAKRDTSVVKEWEEDVAGSVGGSSPEVLEGISFGSWEEVVGAGSSCDVFFLCGFGEGDVGSSLGSWVDVMGVDSEFDFASSDALRKFSSPLRFGTRKLYAIASQAAGG